MVNGESEIDDAHFFLSPNGKTNAKDELDATLDTLLNETRFDDNSTACRFPARKKWLGDELNITNFPEVECIEYDNIVKRLAPSSATLVFPSAHINSPASMFGHTFLRINSKYKSRLLAYAINYAADANPDKENAIAFSIKGLFGGYYGKYSLLPYYEKLKEYRDGEKRDIWEYDLDLSEEEVRQMVRHIWELNGTHSDYYFFTENCSYNMLWFIEAARPSIHLREYFSFEVIPLETVHAVKAEGIITLKSYRPSKRTILLKYEELISDENIHYVRDIVVSKVAIKDFMKIDTISRQQKMYALEAAIEFLEYSFSKNDMNKETYLELFHSLTTNRASLGQGKKLNIKMPANPINSHRAIRTTVDFGYREGKLIGFLGFRPAYHDLEDSDLGFLRGTQIEFLDLLVSYSEKEKLEVENATIISIVSLTQRNEFFSSLSWRMNLGFNRDYLDNTSSFTTTIGAGYSIGNKYAYSYIMIDPLFYINDGFVGGAGTSLGLVIDGFNFMSTNFEATQRYYTGGEAQALLKITQSFRLSQNFQLKFKYNYKDREIDSIKSDEQTYRAVLNYYF
ncbi:MAG: DUF4105 domain-containing protein [Sulfurimonas sp.]|nr:DUF4105 domain-containing protein [Sulfurimonas sp.]